MYDNYIFADVNDALPTLARDVLRRGHEVGSRLGEQTKELTHIGITLTDPVEREILIPERAASLPAQIAESMWILAGRNDIEFLSHYLPRAADFSDDGKTWRSGYGPRIRKWGGNAASVRPGGTSIPPIDQLYYVVRELKMNPTTRQACIQIWDPTVDTTPGKDKACNDFIQFIARNNQLDAHVFIRSNDLIWGWSGINQFEWSVLLEVVAGLVGIEVGSLHFSITSLHIYDRHWDKAEKIGGGSAMSANSSPRFEMPASSAKTVFELDHLITEWFELEEAIRERSVSVREIDEFPEPMMRSWLRVIAYHWYGDPALLAPIAGTALDVASGISPKRKVSGDPFVEYVSELHAEKNAAYGDSWRKRGETLGIMANIARKIDRLGGGETRDETSADTAIDLLVYLVKYWLWLGEEETGDNNEEVAAFLRSVKPMSAEISNDELIKWLQEHFETLALRVEAGRSGEFHATSTLENLIVWAFTLAERLWSDDYKGADHE